MPWIRTVPYEDASGRLKDEYDAAIKRAGRIFNIVSLQSLRPRAMRASIRLYAELMHAPSGRLADALGIDPVPDMPPP